MANAENLFVLLAGPAPEIWQEEKRGGENAFVEVILAHSWKNVNLQPGTSLTFS